MAEAQALTPSQASGAVCHLEVTSPWAESSRPGHASYSLRPAAATRTVTHWPAALHRSGSDHWHDRPRPGQAAASGQAASHGVTRDLAQALTVSDRRLLAAVGPGDFKYY